jgi:hypothetical protein
MPVSECNLRNRNELPWPARNEGTPLATGTLLLLTGLADEATTPTPYNSLDEEREPFIINFASCTGQETKQVDTSQSRQGRQMIPRCFSAAAIWSDQGIDPVPLPHPWAQELSEQIATTGFAYPAIDRYSNWFWKRSF